MFTFASLLDPNYGLSSIEQADQPRWLARFQRFLNKEEENQPLSALVSSFQRFNDSKLSADKLENYVETDSNSEMKNIIVEFFNHFQLVKTRDVTWYSSINTSAFDNRAGRLSIWTFEKNRNRDTIEIFSLIQTYRLSIVSTWYKQKTVFSKQKKTVLWFF